MLDLTKRAWLFHSLHGDASVRVSVPSFLDKCFLVELSETEQSIAVLDWTNEDLAPHLLLGDVLSALSVAGVYMRICGRHLRRRD